MFIDHIFTPAHTQCIATHAHMALIKTMFPDENAHAWIALTR